MFSRPTLSQSAQPKAHYDYDGISGCWLWFPWWAHIALAILAWPISWWLLPLLPFKNTSITTFLWDFRLQIATGISIISVITAWLSFDKAKKIRARDQKKQITQSKVKPIPKPKAQLKSQSKAQPKVEPKVKVQKTEKVEKNTPKIEKKAKVTAAKTAQKGKTKKRTSKKKNDQQLDIFD